MSAHLDRAREMAECAAARLALIDHDPRKEES